MSHVIAPFLLVRPAGFCLLLLSNRLKNVSSATEGQSAHGLRHGRQSNPDRAPPCLCHCVSVCVSPSAAHALRGNGGEFY